MKLAPLLLSFLFAAVCISAQVNPQCPAVSVQGPVGSPQPAELIPFTATVKPTESKLTYKWSIDRGTIVEGQGTPTIKVRFAGRVSGWLVRVEIGGLPSECPHTASESTSIDYAPDPTKLDTFSLPLSSISESRFQKIADAIRNNPNAQIYVLIPADKAVRDSLVARLDKVIGHPYDPPRITIVEMNGKNPIVEVWLVPPGATVPKECKDCKKFTAEPVGQGCPNIGI